MQHQQNRVIDGTEFICTQFGGTDGVVFLAKMGRLCGPALKELIEAVGTGDKGGSKGLGDADIGKVGAALALLFEKLDESEIYAIRDKLLRNAQVIRKDDRGDKTIVPLLPIIDEELRGRTMTFIKLLGFALEVNYGNFTGALQSAASAVGLKVSPSK